MIFDIFDEMGGGCAMCANPHIVNGSNFGYFKIIIIFFFQFMKDLKGKLLTEMNKSFYAANI